MYLGLYIYLPQKKIVSFCFFKDFIFLEQFGCHSKIERKAQGFPIYPLHPPHMYRLPYGQHAPPEWYICCNQWTYTDKLGHPKSIVYIRAHSCCSTFYRFGRMCNGHVSTIVVSQSSFIALKNPLCSACLSSSQPPQTLLITDPLTMCIVSSFFPSLSQ